MNSTMQKIQKIIVFSTIIASGLLLFYALSFATTIFPLYSISGGTPFYLTPDDEIVFVALDSFYYDIQPFNHLILSYAVISLIIVLVIYLFNSAKRKNYYLMNYVSLFAYFIFATYVFITAIPYIGPFRERYLNIDWTYWIVKEYLYWESPFMFDLGYIIYTVNLLVGIGALFFAVYHLVIQYKLSKKLSSESGVASHV